MITLKIEGSEIGIEESALKDMVLSGLPSWLEEQSSKDIKAKTIFLGVKGLSLMMLSDIRRKAAKAGVLLAPPAEDENPVLKLAEILLNYSAKYIEGQSAHAIYHIDGEKIVITGINTGEEIFEMPKAAIGK